MYADVSLRVQSGTNPELMCLLGRESSSFRFRLGGGGMTDETAKNQGRKVVLCNLGAIRRIYEPRAVLRAQPKQYYLGMLYYGFLVCVCCTLQATMLSYSMAELQIMVVRLRRWIRQRVRQSFKCLKLRYWADRALRGFWKRTPGSDPEDMTPDLFESLINSVYFWEGSGNLIEWLSQLGQRSTELQDRRRRFMFAPQENEPAES